MNNSNEFPGVRIAALVAAVPDDYEQIMDYTDQFPEGELEKFCQTTGARERYVGANLKTTASDLCVAAAREIFAHADIDKSTIDALIFLPQRADYFVPPTSCVIQHRLGLDHCGLVYDSNIGCTGSIFGIQMACANLMSDSKRVLVMVGDSEEGKGGKQQKNDLLFGSCGVAMVLERMAEAVSPIRMGLSTIGKGYQVMISPYGMVRHPLRMFYEDRGLDAVLDYANRIAKQGTYIFTFSTKDAPRVAKEFLARFGCGINDYDLISINQADKMIVDNVAKRVKAPAEKVLWSLDRYGNIGGISMMINLCDYVQRENVHQGTKRVFNMAFGIGLNVAVADLTLDMGAVLPIIKTTEVFDDGIDSFTFFAEEEKH